MLTRRLCVAGGLALASGHGAILTAARAAGVRSDMLASALAAIEAQSRGRLGVAVLDTAAGTPIGHRADERFPMCSTFKLLAASAVLARVDAGRDRLDRRVRFTRAEVVPYSPITESHAGGDGLTIEALCGAAITMSDNTAGNLLLASLGGPAGLTAYARSLGDPVTRLDRIEPDLNESIPGDPRDTTSPAAMLSNLRALLTGNALSAPSRDKLTAWLVANKTGDTRVRAGLPAGWRVGDKTGSGDQGSTNDIGIIWPPGRAPILFATYLTRTSASADDRNAALADVGRAVVTALG
jgi:beta-lactamase class A